MLLILVHLSTALLVSSKLISPNVSEHFDSLQTCISKIQEVYCTHEFTIYLNCNKKYRDLQLSQVPVIVDNQFQSLKYFKKFKATFYVIVPSTNLHDVFFTLTRSHSWNPRAKFVVVLESLDNELFTIARKYHVFNIVLLVPEEKHIEIISYFPFESPRPVLIDKCVDERLCNLTNLFPDKLPSTWQNTTVKTLLFTYPPYVINKNGFVYGMEIEALKLVQSVVKFKVVYVKKPFANWGRKLRNGSYEGAYSYFRNYEVDIGLGMFYANQSEYWDFDETYPYMEDNVKWVVPMAKLQQRWLRVLGIFTYEVWIVIFMFFFWISGLIFLVSARVHERTAHRRLTDCLTKCYQYFLGQAVVLPEDGILRMIVGLWVCFGLLITATFQGRLIAVLNINLREPQMTRVDEMIASEIKFGFYSDTALLFSQPNDKNDWYIYQNYQQCPVDSRCLNRVAFKGDFATFKPKKFIEHMISTSYLDEHGNSLIYMFDDNVFNLFITMICVRGFPMYDKINWLLSWIRSAGFVDYFYKKAAFRAAKAIESAKRTSFVFQVITMEEVFWTFWLLLLGLSFASVVFVLEVCVYKLKRSLSF